MIEKFKKGFYFMPIGGTGEFGASLNLYFCDGEFIIIDMGVTFDRDITDEVLVPDPKLLIEIKKRTKAIILTHAHEDHYGSIPYIWPLINVPVYGSKFSIGMLRDKMKEFGPNAGKITYHVFKNDTMRIGNQFEIKLIPVVHSILDAYAFVIKTKYGEVLHTGDWKFGKDPTTGREFLPSSLPQYFDKSLPTLGIVCDSTGASVSENQQTVSEDVVRANMIDLVSNIKKERVMITCFSSNITRLETFAIAAQKTGRSLMLSGRSLKRTEKIARDCGYLKDYSPFVSEDKFKSIPREKVLFVCTGSQGEEKSAMYRIAEGSHTNARVDEGDYVIFSAKAIPGNEKNIIAMQNMLVAKGVKIITNKHLPIHSSGHPTRKDLKDMYEAVKPEAIIPVHGDFMHLYEHKDFALENGIEYAPLVKNGECLDLVTKEIKFSIDIDKLSVEGTKIIPLNGKIITERKQVMSSGLVNVILTKDAKAMKVVGIQFIGLFEQTETKEENKIKAELFDKISKKVPVIFKEKQRDGFIKETVSKIFARMRGKIPFVKVFVI